MNYINYGEINIDNLKYNTNSFKKKYNFQYYIGDVSNNAFGHGMYIVNILNELVDYLYCTNFSDALLIRKYQKDMPLIYGGHITEDNIYDLVINNAILVIRDIKTLENIVNLNIKDKIQLITEIDVKGYNGIDSKNVILDMLEIINNSKYLELVGIKASISEDNYQEFKYIISPIKDVKLFILNNENDKNKIKMSNAIKLDYSMYGVNNSKKRLFQKEARDFKQIFTLKSKIINIKKVSKGNKNKYLAIVPYGYLNGMIGCINKVYINKELFNVIKIYEDYMIIETNSNINVNDIVEIISCNNPIDNYINGNILVYFNLMSSNLPVLYDNYTLEKIYTY